MTMISADLGYDDPPSLLARLTGDSKHDRSSYSTLDAIWVLYDRVLREGDRFLLSKGHGPTASRRASPPRAGRARRWTDATTTRSSTPSRPVSAAARTSSWQR